MGDEKEVSECDIPFLKLSCDRGSEHDMQGARDRDLKGSQQMPVNAGM